MDDILSAIQTYGFPAVFCLLIWWDSRTILREIKKELQELKEAIKCR